MIKALRKVAWGSVEALVMLRIMSPGNIGVGIRYTAVAKRRKNETKNNAPFNFLSFLVITTWLS